MSNSQKRAFLRPISRRINDLGTAALRRSAEAIIRSEPGSSIMNSDVIDSIYDDDNLAPVMPAIDALQQLLKEENKAKVSQKAIVNRKKVTTDKIEQSAKDKNTSSYKSEPNQSSFVVESSNSSYLNNPDVFQDRDRPSTSKASESPELNSSRSQRNREYIVEDNHDDDEVPLIRNNPLNGLLSQQESKKQDEYEFIPKSVILDVYSNDPEVKRFLKQLPKIGTEFGYNEQDYKCYSCRRPIGMVFGQSRLCHFDGHHYCYECHLGEKANIPARILCNWDFNKYPISKRNQHFLNLISNEPMFELKIMAPLLYKTCPELKEIEELRCQAFFIRSYCFTCVQESISFELTKLVWPREHLIKQTDLYSLDDFIQIKSGALKSVLKNVITFGRQHVLSCMLCCQRGFICELCKSSQIIYPFDTESVYRCDSCQSIYHKACFESIPKGESCPRCQRLKTRRNER